MKQIKGFQDYSITENGQVFSHKTNKFKKPFVFPTGYIGITLSKNAVSKNYYLHRIVADNYISNPNNKPQVNHIDGNKVNNSISNLEWVTSSQNNFERCKRFKKSGKKHWKAKLTTEQVIEIRKYFIEGKTYRWIAKIYKVSLSTLWAIKFRKIWTHV